MVLPERLHAPNGAVKFSGSVLGIIPSYRAVLDPNVEDKGIE